MGIVVSFIVIKMFWNFIAVMVERPMILTEITKLYILNR